ncbi:MAG TPA: hypothetical protein OIM07_00825 [Clostridiales bacterium]|nr:hypothetical protein [Clostridiales bacterium]
MEGLSSSFPIKTALRVQTAGFFDVLVLGEIPHYFQMHLEIVSDVIYHPSLALRAQLLQRCSRRAFCFAMLSGRAHRRDNVQVMGNADWGGASADAQRYNRCAESASLFSARGAELSRLA